VQSAKARLLLALSDEAQVGAEAEALDTDLKRSATAMEQARNSIFSEASAAKAGEGRLAAVPPATTKAYS
jgi:hypothetical protein